MSRKGFRAGKQRRGGMPTVQSGALRMGRETKFWEELDQMDRECLAAETSGGVVLPYLQDAAMRPGIDIKGLDMAVQNYTGLVRQQKERRKQLSESWRAFRDSNPAPGPTTLVKILDFSQEYNSWLHDWVAVVLFNADMVLDHFRAVGHVIPKYSPYSAGWKDEAVQEFFRDNPHQDHPEMLAAQSAHQAVAATQLTNMGQG